MSSKMKPSGSFGYRFIKRLFDIVCSTILMVPIGIVIIISEDKEKNRQLSGKRRCSW